MPPISSEQFRLLRVAGYFVAIATIAAQIAELLLRSWPLQIHSAAWRLGFVGATAGIALTVLFMTLFILGGAVIMGNRAAALTVVGLSITASLVYLLLGGTFVLDAIQMRNQVPMSQSRNFDVTSAWVMARQVLGAIGFALVGFGGLRAIRSGAKHPEALKASSLVVGRNRPHTPVPAGAAQVDDTAGIKGG